ncbi:MAG: hypothetical protein NUV98_07250, partial [Candidatus Roizmanbacteria bacterium]|nr:hypothetical protein [Candidatus Roizmanbacteria bacterium]
AEQTCIVQETEPLPADEMLRILVNQEAIPASHSSTADRMQSIYHALQTTGLGASSVTTPEKIIMLTDVQEFNRQVQGAYAEQLGLPISQLDFSNITLFPTAHGDLLGNPNALFPWHTQKPGTAHLNNALDAGRALLQLQAPFEETDLPVMFISGQTNNIVKIWGGGLISSDGLFTHHYSAFSQAVGFDQVENHLLSLAPGYLPESEEPMEDRLMFLRATMELNMYIVDFFRMMLVREMCDRLGVTPADFQKQFTESNIVGIFDTIQQGYISKGYDTRDFSASQAAFSLYTLPDKIIGNNEWAALAYLQEAGKELDVILPIPDENFQSAWFTGPWHEQWPELLQFTTENTATTQADVPRMFSTTVSEFTPARALRT